MELEAGFGAYTTKEPFTLGEKESFLCVRCADVYADGKMTEKETKTKAGTRVIPIQPGREVYRILQTARKMYTEYQTLSACHYEPDEVGHGKTGRDFREYESGITVAVNDVTAVLMEGISSGIPFFALLTKISWEFYCKQEKLFV